jgi:hypothetical protein
MLSQLPELEDVGETAVEVSFHSLIGRRMGNTLLQQYTACETIVHVPEVDARYAALKVPGHVSVPPLSDFCV